MSARDYPERPILAVSTAVLRGGTVLVAQRLRAPGAGLYSLPGGVVELGETLHEAAARELFEEVGVVAEPIAVAAARDILARDAAGRVMRHFVVVTLATRWVSGEGAASEEAGDPRFVRLDDLAGLPTTEGLIATVERAFALAR